MYVGQTRLDLNTKLREQKINNKNRKMPPGCFDINDTCPGIENLSVIPAEEVPQKEL